MSDPGPRLHTVAVYCGSSDGNNPAFKAAATELGNLFLKRNISLVYGGGSRGTMGVIARTIHQGGGKVQGIIPEFFVEITKPLIGETVIVEDMHTRKKMMSEKADAFIALPGGIGTMEELVEMICWYKLKLHRKPIGILNINNFYAGFLDWYDKAWKEGFLEAHEDLSNMINVSNSCEKLLDMVQSKIPTPANNDVDHHKS